MTTTPDRVHEALPCPFCGKPPEWLSKSIVHGTGASGMEAPMRALGCNSPACQVKPRTAWMDTERHEYGIGYFKVDFDAIAIRNWNRRA